MAESTSLDAVPVRCVASVTPEMPEYMSRDPTAALWTFRAISSVTADYSSIALATVQAISSISAMVALMPWMAFTASNDVS
jgi:hypothetical protein